MKCYMYEPWTIPKVPVVPIPPDHILDDWTDTIFMVEWEDDAGAQP